MNGSALGTLNPSFEPQELQCQTKDNVGGFYEGHVLAGGTMQYLSCDPGFSSQILYRPGVLCPRFQNPGCQHPRWCFLKK